MPEDCTFCGYINGHADMPGSFIDEACRLARELCDDDPLSVRTVVDNVMAPVIEARDRAIADYFDVGT